MEDYLFEKKKLKKYLGDKLYDVLKAYKVIVAGGTITSLFTNRDINDIDIYFKSKENLGDFLRSEMEGKWVIAHTDKAFLFKYNKIEIQAIYFKYFDNPQEIFKTFDFTVCMGAYDFETEQFVLHKDFVKHNSQRILKFNQGTAYPIVSALRIDKYKKKGYTISKPEFIRVMLTILKSEINDYKTLKEQMGGMYGENYDKLLKPVEGEEFDLASIIEKMVDLSVDDAYFNQSETIDIDDWDEFVYKALGEKMKYFEYDDICYYVVNKEIRECDEFDEKLHKKVDISDIITFPQTRYKYVRKNNDKYCSFYTCGYQYHIGKYSVAESKRYGVHAVTVSDLNSCSYCNDNRNNVLLEVRIDNFDDISSIENALDDTCDYKKVFIVREVPKEEEAKLRNKNDSVKDVDDFLDEWDDRPFK